MIHAIARLNVPDKIIKILHCFYSNPSFRIKDREGYSSFYKQSTGIRQGCPLSPYLFILFMTVMFWDVHRELDFKLGPGMLDHIDFMEFRIRPQAGVAAIN